MTQSPPSPPFPLLAYLDGLVRSLVVDATRAIHEHDADAVHRSRVATRRLGAAIALLAPALEPDRAARFRKTLKRLRRSLGELRDLDVMIGHLAEFRSARHKPAAKWVRARLESERDEHRENLDTETASESLGKLRNWSTLRQPLLDKQSQIDDLLAASLHAQLDQFAQESDRLTAQLAAPASPPSPSEPPPAKPEPARQDPHELRITGKALRYTIEMAVEQGHRLPKDVAKQFKEMQSALGLWHDYVVLAERMLSLSLTHTLALHDPALQRQVLDLAAATLKKCETHLAHFADLWRTHGPTIAEAIHAAFPTAPSSSAPQAPEPSDRVTPPSSGSGADAAQ